MASTDRTMIKTVDDYLISGCMRCKFGDTPQCKVHDWKEELLLLREIMLSCKLSEEIKWGVPCYTAEGRNIVIIGALRECCTVGFFKGALLTDEKCLLTSPGEHSQSVRQLRFTSTNEVKSMAPAIRRFVKEALELEKSGKKVVLKKSHDHAMPEAFRAKLDAMPALKKAFTELTPGRKRSYLLHFSSAKQPATMAARIEKCIPMIMQGIGFNEIWKRNNK